MKRRLSLLAAFLLILVFGVTSTTVAQPLPESEGITSRSGLHSPQDLDRSSAVLTEDRARTVSSQASVQQAMLKHVESDPVLPTTTVDLPVSSTIDLQAQSDSGNGGRRVAYIVGGVLVVGGAIAGILALSSRGGGNGGAGIPPPETRP